MFLASIALLLLAPDSCAQKLTVALTALQQKNPAQASSILEANREECSQTSFYSELSGTTSELLGKPAAAEEAYKKAVSLEPNNARFRFELGASYFEAGEAQDAVRELKRGLELDPSNRAGERYLLGVYVALQDWQNASNIFESLGVFDHPHLLKDPVMILWFARVLVETKRTERIALLLSPDGPEMTSPLLFSLGGLFASHGVDSEVVRFLSHIPDRDADDAVYFNLAEAYSHLQEFDKARGCYFRAIDKHPGHIEAYLHVGLDYGSSGQMTKAVPWLAQAHKLAPDRVDISFALAEQLIHLGYFDSADDLLKTGDVPTSEDPLLMVAAGDLKAAQGRSDEAMRLYQNALMKKPGLVQALVSLAESEIGQDKYDEARQSLDLAFKASPDDPAAEGSLGLLEYKKGLWKSAAVHLETAWEHNHANWQIGLELGRSLRRTGRLDDALGLLISLKAGLDDSPAYHLELSQLYDQLHRSAESKAQLDAFNALQKTSESLLRFDKPHTYVF
jgi:tetratricopeptide (TPR) repeat protein